MSIIVIVIVIQILFIMNTIKGTIVMASMNLIICSLGSINANNKFVLCFMLLIQIDLEFIDKCFQEFL